MEQKQYVIVRLDQEIYGVDIQQVQVIERLSRITRVPQAPSFIKGVINLRGDIIPVMSLRDKLHMGVDEYSNDTRIIIVKTKKNVMGLIVDEVKEVMDLDTADMENVHEFSSKINSEYIKALGKVDGDIVVILNINGLVDNN